MALMIAIALWFYAVRENSVEWACTVRVEVKTPEDVAVISQSADKIYATFEGPERLIRELKQNYQSRTVVATCRIEVGPEADVTPQTSQIRFDDVKNLEGVPDGIRFKYAPEPAHVLVTVMKLTQKSLPVKLLIQGDPPAGYSIVPNSEAIFPAEVMVKGPKTALDAAECIYTEPFPISKWPTLGEDKVNISNSIKLQQFVRIRTPDGERTPEVTCTDTVRFWIDIVRKKAQVTLAKIPVKILRPSDFAFDARPVEDRVDLQFAGPKTVLDKLTITNVLVFVDVTGLQPSKVPHSLPAICYLPAEAQGVIEVKGPLPKIGVDVVAREAPPKPKPEGKE